MQPRPITAVDAGSSSGTGSGGQTIVTGTPTVGSAVQVSCAQSSPAPPGIVVIAGTFVGTLVIETSYNGGVTWNGTIMVPVGETTPVTSITTPGTIIADIEGATNARVRCTAYTSGTAMVSLKPGRALPLPIQTRLSVTPGITQNLLIWGAIPGATGYNVYSGTAAGTETLLAGNQAGPTYTDSGLTANTTHYYYVTVVNANGESLPSNEVIGVVLPSAPTSLAATGSASSIALTWVAPTGGAVSYNVYRGTAAGAEAPLHIANVTGLAYTDTLNLVFGTTYFYVVRAINAGGRSVVSNEVSSAEVPVITSVTSPTGALISGGLLEIAGSGFNGVTAVTFSAGPLRWTSLRSAPSDTIIRANYFPVNSAGSVNVVLTYPGGTVSSPITLVTQAFGATPTQTNLATSTWMPQTLYAFAGWDGNLWWISNSVPATSALKVGDIWNSTLAGTVTEYNLPGSVSGHSANQIQLCAGPDKAMYSLSGKTTKILFRIALPATPGQGITSIDLSTSIGNPARVPLDVKVGPDGNIWALFADTSSDNGSVLVKLSTTLQILGLFTYPGWVILGVLANKNGNLYAVASTVPYAANATTLLEINTNGFVLNTNVIPLATDLKNPVYGSDGFIYFVNGAGVLKVNTNLVTTTQIAVTVTVALQQITQGPDGKIWVTVNNQTFTPPGADSGFAIIDQAGSVNAITITGSAQSGHGQTFGIVPGSDGNMYVPVYTDHDSGAIGYLVRVAHS